MAKKIKKRYEVFKKLLVRELQEEHIDNQAYTKLIHA